MKRFCITILLLCWIVCTPLIVLASSRFTAPTVPSSHIKMHRAKIKWEPLQQVAEYKLRLLNHDCSERIKTYTINSSKNHKVIKSLDTGTKYCIRMRVNFNDGSHDKFSKRVTFTTLADTATDTDDGTTEPEVTPVQFGLNFIPFFSDDSDALTVATQPAAIEATFDDLGVQIFRQLTSADLHWSNVEASQGVFTFDDADAVLMTTDHTVVVDLFANQYADGTAPWEAVADPDTVTTTLTAAAETYVATVVDRYKNYVTYWEIGNEMDHWQSEGNAFTPEAQGAWFAQVAAVIRAHDAAALIVMPGMGNLNDYDIDTWLPGVVAGGGTDWFDVVNYHFYSRWQTYEAERADLDTELATLGISDKIVWMSEAGTTSDSTLTRRTNYPNSTSEQAADVFRRIVPSYAAGDTVAIWHTLFGNDDSTNDFRYYGIFDSTLSKKLAYYSIQLLTSELLPFSTVEKQSSYLYKVTKIDGTIRYVAWSGSTGTITVPANMSSATSVVSDSSGDFTWSSVIPNATLTTTTTPILLK